MNSKEIRNKFVKFFQSKGHTLLESASLIPENDPTALFNVAGMQPLVPYLMGKKHPKGDKLMSCQKCFRTVDIDDVGDNRHCTFFEMLGNWSLGSYFKKEAIEWADEFLVKELGFDKEKLNITVFEGNDVVGEDKEAIEYWKVLGYPENRIYKLGVENNWWPTFGAMGPCGSDSEIHYDTGKLKCNEHCNPSCDCGKYIEIWNLVFMEYYCDGNGKFTKLEQKNIDTGAGLERLACLLQGKETVFETDLFESIVEKIEELTGEKYFNSDLVKENRIVADHVRASVFLIADGVYPSNEGRGYVLRRILRRAIYNLRKINKDKAKDLYQITDAVFKHFGEVYPEIVNRKDKIIEIIQAETDQFLNTIDNGEKILMKMITDAKAKNNPQICGEEAFKLYDTYGFPISLTEEIAKENDCEIDMECFVKNLGAQKERSREGSKDMFKRGRENVQTMLEGIAKTQESVGQLVSWSVSQKLDELKVESLKGKGSNKNEFHAKILKVIPLDNEEVAIVTDKTIFYAESGGQVGDTGWIEYGDGVLEVVDTQKYDGVWVHFCRNASQTVILANARIQENGQKLNKLDSRLRGNDNIIDMQVTLKLDMPRRKKIMSNHSAAHLLHSALRKYLGESVEQAGSYVDESRCRFDFSYNRALTNDELIQVEREINDRINDWLPVSKSEMKIDEAKKLGAMALFTEKYGETVRVVNIGDGYSIELCGGTHVDNTSEIGIAKILKDSSIASGIRRIEMITGANVYEYLNEQEGIVKNLFDEVKATQNNEIVEKVKGLKQTIKDLEKINCGLKRKVIMSSIDEYKGKVVQKDGHKFIELLNLEACNIDQLKDIVNIFKEQKIADFGILTSDGGNFVIFSTIKEKSARDMFKEFQEKQGGKGGGTDEMVQGVGATKVKGES